MSISTFSGVGAAETAESFYKGQKIRWIVPYRVGGGYDQYSRLLAPYLEKYSGARVDIVNMPGAGGMKGAVEIFRSPPDGLHLGLINGGAVLGNELAGKADTSYRISDYTLVGRITVDERVMLVRTGSEFSSFADLKAAERPIVTGTVGRATTTFVDAVVAGRLFGLTQKLVFGFDSSSDVRLALLRGDIDAMWISFGSAEKGLRAGDFKAVLCTGRISDPLLEGVPQVDDLAKEMSDADKALLGAWSALTEVGRPVMGPPGIPEERTDFLRNVLVRTLNDPELIAAITSAGRRLNFQDSEDLARTIARAGKMDEATGDILLRAIRGEIPDEPASGSSSD